MTEIKFVKLLDKNKFAFTAKKMNGEQSKLQIN